MGGSRSCHNDRTLLQMRGGRWRLAIVVAISDSLVQQEVRTITIASDGSTKISTTNSVLASELFGRFPLYAYVDAYHLYVYKLGVVLVS